jgi:hypothetical protein
MSGIHLETATPIITFIPVDEYDFSLPAVETLHYLYFLVSLLKNEILSAVSQLVGFQIQPHVVRLDRVRDKTHHHKTGLLDLIQISDLKNEGKT